MNEDDLRWKIREFLQHLPDKPSRSKLEPYRELVRQLRQKLRTYREIAAVLADSFELCVDPSTIYDFLKVRSRPSDERRFELSLPPQLADPTEPSTTCSAPHPAQNQTDVYAHYEALKRRKRTSSPPQPKPAFHYEEGEPLRLIVDPKKKGSERI